MSRKSMMPPPKLPASRFSKVPGSTIPSTRVKPRFTLAETAETPSIPNARVKPRFTLAESTETPSIPNARVAPMVRKQISLDATIIDDSSEEEIEQELGYNKLLQTLMIDCLLDEAIRDDKKKAEKQLNDLSNEFQKNLSLLQNTQARLNDIYTLSEHHRILQKKKHDYEKVKHLIENKTVENIFHNHTTKQNSILDRIETENVDFGYNEEIGHKQLNEALDDALSIIKCVQKHSNLDLTPVTEIDEANKLLSGIDKDVTELKRLKKDLNVKLPQLNEKLLINCSEKLEGVLDDPDINDRPDYDSESS